MLPFLLFFKPFLFSIGIFVTCIPSLQHPNHATSERFVGVYVIVVRTVLTVIGSAARCLAGLQIGHLTTAAHTE